MLLFVLLLIALAALAQYFLSGSSLTQVQEEFRPEVNIADPDQDFHLVITLNNAGRRILPFLRFSMFLPEAIEPLDTSHCAKGHEREGHTVSYTTWLRPHQQTQFRIPVRIRRRGRIVFRPLILSGGDFLGLNEQKREYSRFREVVIAPREAPAVTIETAMGGFLGDFQVRRFIYEDPILTAGFREYTGQEPMKKISWTQSARGRGIMVRNDDYTVEPTMSVVLNTDTHGAASPGELEACCSIARTVCRILEDRRIPYDLLTNAATAGGWFDDGARHILKGIGAVHFEKVLELLGRVTDIVSLSDRDMIEEIEKSRTVCGRILITPDSSIPEESLLRRLRGESDGMLLLLTPQSCGVPPEE